MIVFKLDRTIFRYDGNQFSIQQYTDIAELLLEGLILRINDIEIWDWEFLPIRVRIEKLLKSFAPLEYTIVSDTLSSPFDPTATY